MSPAKRHHKHQKFLQNHFTGEVSVTSIPGDAGFRSYFRISPEGEKTCILMDCPPSYCSIKPFIEIADYLRSKQFLAPKIIAYDIQEGLMILEDFGDLSVKKFLQNSVPQVRENIYYNIIDILISLNQHEPPTNLRIFNNDLLLSELELFTDWYIPFKLKRNLNTVELTEYKEIWQRILLKQKPFKTSIILRDYHVENMMYLEQNRGLNKFGLLDFQDALIGSPIYDLVSLLEDARIEVPRELALSCIKYFAKKMKFPLDDVLTNYHILGAQRNSRILGVFARKNLRDGNDNYLQFIPLVLKYLDYDLSYPELSELKEWYKFL